MNIKLTNKLKIDIAGRVSRRYLERTEPRYLAHFNYLWTSLSKLESIEAIVETLLKPAPKAILRDSLARAFDNRQFNSIVANINKVTGYFLEELSSNEGAPGPARIHLLLDTSIRKADTPEWLLPRLRKYLLPLFIDETVGTELIEKSKFIEKPFIFYINADSRFDGDEKDANKYWERAEKGKFDIFVDEVVKPEVIVRQQRNAFQIDHKLPTRILCHLLTRVGHDVSFREIYEVTIGKKLRLSEPKSNEKIRKSLAYMHTRLNEMKGINPGEPSHWFERTKNTNVHVWKKLNSCLITSVWEL